MSSEMGQAADLYTQLDITAESQSASVATDRELAIEQIRLLRDIVAAQDRQNELIEELLNHFTGSQKQRAAELAQWKKAHPELVNGCRQAAEALSKVQTVFVERLAEDVNDQSELLIDGEFMFNEFVDRYGPRLAHLNGVLQVLAQLGGPSASSENPV